MRFVSMAAGVVSVGLMVGCGGSSAGGGGATAPILAAPVANTGGPYTAVAGTAVTFNGGASKDPQGQALTYAWTFGDGGTGTGVSPTHSYASPGTFTVSLTVTDTSALTGSATGMVTVTAAPDFALLASPQSVAVAAGTSEVVDLLATPVNGFAGTVTATLSGLPAGVTAGASSYTLTPGIVTQATLTASSNVAAAVVQATVTGVSGTISHSAVLELTAGLAPDYTLALNGVGVSLTAGSSQVITVTATAENGFTGAVAASVSGLPVGVTASPASFSLSAGTGVPVTLTAGPGAVVGNTVATVVSTSGSTIHSLPLLVNYEAQAQDFVVVTPVAINIAPGGTTSFDIATGAVNGFAGVITLKVTGQPAGVSGGGTSTVSLAAGGISSTTVTLTGASTLTNGTTAMTITATSGSLTHTNSILITTAPGVMESATVNTTNPGTAFPSYFVGFSMPWNTLAEFAGPGATTWPSFINLLSDLGAYVGAPSMRNSMGSLQSQEIPTISEMAALEKGATFTVKGVTTSPQYFVTVPSTFEPSVIASNVQGLISAVGSLNLLGVEMDNEPDLYVSNGYRPVGWSFTDWLNETETYETTFAPFLTAPKYIVSAASSADWNVGNPALQQQMSGQIAAFTEHEYGTTSCSNTPTVASLLMDRYSHNYYARYAALVKTWSPVPVRVGEMNSVACSGYAGVSNVFAASLWVVDTAFEAAAAGTVGFNLHSNGTTAAPALYDIGYDSGNGNLSVYPPFYGMLFFAEAIQNGAKPLPVTVTQSAGNIKVWATIDAANTVRVVVLEKDTDGLANVKTVMLNLGGYTKAGTVTVMSAPTLGSTSGITIAGQTFDGTTNGVLTGTASSSSVTSVNGIYTLTVQDGTATMLTVPQ